MRNISIDLNSLIVSDINRDNPIRELENKASQLLITLSEEFLGYKYYLCFKLNDNIPYKSAELTPIDDVITYEITNALTFESGSLLVELQAIDTVDNVLVKSALISLTVKNSIESTTLEIPNDYLVYVQLIEHYMDNEIYDPNLVLGDVFDMDNMLEGSTNLILTTQERENIATLMEYFNNLPT